MFQLPEYEKKVREHRHRVINRQVAKQTAMSRKMGPMGKAFLAGTYAAAAALHAAVDVMEIEDPTNSLPMVGMDTNALVAAIEGGPDPMAQASVLGEIEMARPYVSPRAALEFVQGPANDRSLAAQGGRFAELASFMTTEAGVPGMIPFEGAVQHYMTSPGPQFSRGLRRPDAEVLGSAMSGGVLQTLTRDNEMQRKFPQDVKDF